MVCHSHTVCAPNQQLLGTHLLVPPRSASWSGIGRARDMQDGPRSAELRCFHVNSSEKAGCCCDTWHPGPTIKLRTRVCRVTPSTQRDDFRMPRESWKSYWLDRNLSSQDSDDANSLRGSFKGTEKPALRLLREPLCIYVNSDYTWNL